MDNEKIKEQLKEITEQLEQGIKDVFESEKYQAYLNTMSKFYNYSFNNTMLIAMQKPDATLIAGYHAWQNKFKRHVNKEEKAIRIISPAPVKIKEEREKLDPDTQEPILDEKNQPVYEEVEVTIPQYKVTPVFDISQTEGEPLPHLAVEELTGQVQNYPFFMQALMEVSPVPIGYEEIQNGAKGYYHLEDKRIAIQSGISEIQTVKTAIHEVSHATLHHIDLKNPKAEMPKKQQKDRKTKEVEAESIAYTVCQHYGIDTSDYSFGYIAGWSSGKNMSELRSSLETIRKTASELITQIDGKVQEIVAVNQKTEDLEREPSVMKQAEKYIDLLENKKTIFTVEERNLIVNYAYKTNNFEKAKNLADVLAFQLENTPNLVAQTVLKTQEEINVLDGIMEDSKMSERGYFGEEMSENLNQFAILQLRRIEETRDLRFMDLDFMKNHGLEVRKENYDLMYTAPLKDKQTLDDIFEEFNMFRPEDFKGHSLSVSDIVVLQQNEKATAYFVDSIGFKEIPNFFLEKQIAQENKEFDNVLLNEINEIAYAFEDKYISIHSCEDGYDYSIYDKNYKLLDGGVYDDSDISIYEAVTIVLEIEGNAEGKLQIVDFDALEEWAEKANAIVSNSLQGITPLEIEKAVIAYAQKLIDEYDLEVELLDAKVYGSRGIGAEKEESDLDVVLEYKSKTMKEDAFFNLLHETKFTIEGMEVDINPITADKSDTIEEYLQRANQYQQEKIVGNKKEENEKQREVSGQSISFYVAECMEFPTLGEYHEGLTLKEAAQILDTIPAERMSGGKGIGFTLHAGTEPSMDDSTFELYSFSTIDVDTINHIEEFRENELVQQAIKDIKMLYPNARVFDRETREQENQEKLILFEKESESLAVQIDDFSEQYSPYEYRDGVADKGENIAQIAKELRAGEIEHIRDWLQAVIGEEEPLEDVKQAEELLKKIDELEERRDKNPIAKVEELEEANYNQIDGVLNNSHPKEEKKSIREAMKEKKEQIIKQDSKMEKKKEIGIE